MESDRNPFAERGLRTPISAVWLRRWIPFEVGDESAGLVERQLEVQPAVRDAGSGDVGADAREVAAFSGGVGNAVILG